MKRLAVLLFGLLFPLAGHATVTTLYNSVSFSCTGSTGPYPFTFPISDPTAMTVIQNGVPVGATSYTITPVNNNYNNGGSVTLGTACPSGGTLLLLKRVTPLTQTQVFTDNMPIPMKSIENGLDKLTEIAQDQQAILNLGIVANILPGTNTSCTPFVNGACTGNVTINTTPSGSGMLYPGPGIPSSSGSAWGPSYTTLNLIPANFLAQIPPGQVIPSLTNGQILTTQGGATSWQAPTGSSSIGGSVAFIDLTNGGTYTVCPTAVTFTGGGLPGQPAAAIPICTNEGGGEYAVTSLQLTDAGYGYTSTPSISITGGTGGGATASALMGSYVTSLTTIGTGAATLTDGILNIPVSSGGSGCAIGTCIVNAGTATQTITQGLNSFILSNTNTAITSSLLQQEIFLNDNGPGWDCGNSGTGCTGWKADKSLWFNVADSSRGIFQGIGMNQNHNGQGDTALLYGYLNPFGGCVAASDECVTPLKIQSHQKGFGAGVVAGSPSTGATAITTNSFGCVHPGSNGNCSAFAYNNSWDDGGIIFNSSHPGTSLTLGAESAYNGAISYALASGTVTASSAVVTIAGSTCTPNGNGQGQVYIATTCTFSTVSGTLVPASSGCTTINPVGSSLDVGLVGSFQEETCIQSVSGSSVTFITRYAWNLGTTLMMQGGPISGAIVATASLSTWPVAYMIAGAPTTTSIVISNCYANSGCGIGGTIPAAGTVVTVVPAAFITGSASAGASVNIGVNNMSTANGDILFGAPTSEFQQIGISSVYGQTTPWGNFAPGGYLSQDDGPYPSAFDFYALNNSGSSKFNMILQSGAYQYWIRANTRPSVAAFFVQGSGSNYCVWSDYSLGCLTADITNSRYGSNIAFEAPNFYDLGITGSATNCLYADTSGLIHGTGSACGSSGGAVSSVANSDGTLTISPTTGVVVASIALGHANTWTAAQTFTGPVTVNGSSQGLVFAAGTATSGTAGSVVYSVDSTHGWAEVNENNTGLDRLCSTGNYQCSPPNTAANGSYTNASITLAGGVITALSSGATNVCGGSGSTCLLQQINPTPNTTTTTTASMTTSQTTIPVSSGTEFTFTPGNLVVIGNSTVGTIEFIPCTGYSGGNLTGCTRSGSGNYGTTAIAWPSGSTVSQVTFLNAGSGTAAPTNYYLANGAYGAGGGQAWAPNSAYYGSNVDFVGGAVLTGASVFLSAGLSTTIYTPQFTVYNTNPGSCETTTGLFSMHSGSIPWGVASFGSGCTTGTNHAPPQSLAFTPGTTSANPGASSVPAAWLTYLGVFNVLNSYQIGGNTILPSTLTSYEGNSSATDVPLALPWTTPSALTAVCHDANGNLTDASCPGGGSSTPAISYETHNFSVSSGAIAFAAGGFGTYNANQPTLGSVNPASTSAAYALFAATPSSPQYAELTIDLPPYWSTVGYYLDFYSTSTSGNAVFDVQTACVTAGQTIGSPTFSSVITTTTAVSGTASELIKSAITNSLFTPGANGCPAAGTTIPTKVIIRFYADSTSAVPIYGQDVVLAISRTQ